MTFLLVQDSDRDVSAKSDEIEVIVRTKRVVEENPDSEKAEKPINNIQAALEAGATGFTHVLNAATRESRGPG